MSFAPDVPIDVLVCYGKERGTKYPHWMLMLVSQGAQTGTWYHSIGGPTQNTPYTLSIQANKRLDSNGISSKELIGQIMPKDVNKVKAAAQRVPPQQCQRYVVALVHELEKKGLAHKGGAVRLNGKVQMSERAQAYAVQNPVTHPSGAYVPPSQATANGSSSGQRKDQSTKSKTTQEQSKLKPQSASQQKKPKKKSSRCNIM